MPILNERASSTLVMGNQFSIAGRVVSEHTAPLVIVEIGINHGGSLTTAKKMVDAASAAGAEIIKHQTHILDAEMTSAAKGIIPENADRSIYDVIEACMLTEQDERQLLEYVHSKGLIFISTPFSREAADRLARFDVPAYKIGSGECNNYPLIRYIAALGKPIILSTGMNGLEDVEKAVQIIRNANVPFALLHCTNIYPTPPELVRLGALADLRSRFPDAVVGLSDHTTTNHACFGAVAMGACILERHFTDDMSREGPDIACSMDPQALRELIAGSAIIAQCRGGTKSPLREESPCAEFAFATVVTTERIAEGDRFTRFNLWVKRPGTGEIKAEHYERVLGRTSTRNLEVGHHLSLQDIDGSDWTP